MTSPVWVELAASQGERSLLDATRALTRVALGARDDAWNGQLVVVKIATGELGNTSYLRPGFVRAVIDELEAAGAEAVATETTSLYPGARFAGHSNLNTAAHNGYTHLTLGVPLVPGDGLRGEWFAAAPSASGLWPQIEVAGVLAAADAVVVVSHFRGHVMSGTGGAIKHLGMGCLARAGKARVHSANRPLLDPSLCTGCGECVRNCPFDGLITENKLVTGLDPERCTGCLNCLYYCPAGVITYDEDCWRPFLSHLGAAAADVCAFLAPRPVLYVNCAIDLTPGCDCDYNAGAPIGPDYGLVAGYDPVGVDAACLDATRSLWPEQRMQQSLVMLQAAEAAGAGRSEYDLRVAENPGES